MARALLMLLGVIIFGALLAEASSCGLNLTDQTGSFISPNYPFGYENETHCSWFITTAPGTYIHLRLTLGRDNDEECTEESVTVYENLDGTVPLARYCGETYRAEILSADNTLLVAFFSDHDGYGRGFSASYTASSDCEFPLTDPSGSFGNHNSPSDYPDGSTCSWLIISEPGTFVRLQFDEFDLEDGTTSNSCPHDYIRIYYGTQSSLIPHGIRHCGTDNPGVIIGTGNTMLIEFFSDFGTSGSFSASYETVTSRPECMHSLTDPSGNISTPGYPRPYPLNIDCSWTITTEPGTFIRLEFTDFDLENSASCFYDYVTIHYSTAPGTDLIQQGRKLCGRWNPGTWYSGDNRMRVEFHSNFNNAGRGFFAFYTTVARACELNLTDPAGSFSSTNYPRGYLQETHCSWFITTAPGTFIYLSFLRHYGIGHYETSYHLHYHSPEPCPGSRVSVYDNLDETGLLGRYCGPVSPAESLTDDNTMLVVFTSVGSGSFFRLPGFSAVYESIVQSDCVLALTAPTGVFSSPGYPGNYPNDMDCSWYITTAQGTYIRLTFNPDFELEASDEDCASDNVTVYANLDGTVPLAKYCGDTAPVEVLSADNTLLVVFSSDHSGTGKGFSASYTASSDCDFVLTDHSGSFGNPDYPRDYPDRSTCSWMIITEPETFVRLQFDEFDLEGGTNRYHECPYDYIRIYYGTQGSLIPHGYRHCGTDNPRVIFGTGNTMLIEFFSDMSSSGTFFASYETVTSRECMHYLTDPSGNISTPGYPRRYHFNIDCSWNITTEPGTFIRLEFTDFDLENSSFSCQWDYVTIHYSTHPGTDLIQQGSRYCGIDVPGIFYSGDNRMRVEFHSDSDIAGSGFFASYTTVASQVCESSLTGPSGIITIPKYPKEGENCTWSITTPPGTIIQLSFGITSYPPGDSITIYDDLEGAIQLGRYSLSELRGYYLYSTKNTMLLNLVSADLTTRRIAWSYTSECGYSLTDPSGSFSSPGHPHYLPPDSECAWSITTPPGTFIRLQFDDFDLPYDCDDHHVTIYDEQSILIDERLALIKMPGQFCGTRNPQLWYSTDNSMLVVLRTASRTFGSRGVSFSYVTVDTLPDTSCKMYRNNTVSPYHGPGFPVPASGEKQLLTSFPDSSDKCRFNIRTKFNNRGLIFMSFGAAPGQNKYAVSFKFNQHGNGNVREQKYGTSGKEKIDASDGYQWSNGDTTVLVEGTPDTGYNVTSLSGCGYLFQYFHNAEDGEPTFVAHLSKYLNVNENGFCGAL